MAKSRSALMQALAVDNSLPIDEEAAELWLRDMDNPTRWVIRPLLQFIFAFFLHLTWLFKRLPFPQFRAHNALQSTICWFCKHFVSYEANLLILRHYATESNILNFLADNSRDKSVGRVALYPNKINDMQRDSFVQHDKELFRLIKDLGRWQHLEMPVAAHELCWDHWQPIDMNKLKVEKRWSQFIDFETAHALFMCLFCLLLTRDEYRDAINGFNLDQSIAIRIGQLVGAPNLTEIAYNKYPLYPVGPWNLSQRFLMHGFFTEHLYAYLANIKAIQ